MQLGLFAFGKLKEKYWQEAFKNYEKRLGKAFVFKEFKEERLTQNPSDAEISQALDKEAQTLLAALPEQTTLILLSKEGKMMDSEKFSKQLTQWQRRGGPVIFVIGSSYGLSDILREKAHGILSFSPMTFPHQLMRVLFMEQLYRAKSIEAGEPYHK